MYTPVKEIPSIVRNLRESFFLGKIMIICYLVSQLNIIYVDQVLQGTQIIEDNNLVV